MKTHGAGIVTVAAILAMMLGASCSVGTKQGGYKRGGDPLWAGWRIAGAITNDADDRAECQMRVAMAEIARGDVETVLARANGIGDWRKGVVLAEAAAKLAEAGRTNEAVGQAAMADAIALDIQDWQRDLIRVRAAKARAMLGQREMAGATREFYTSNRDYRGESAAYYALALARQGRQDEALATLDGLADSDFIDVTTWRAKGYAMVGALRMAETGAVARALGQAWEASQRIGGSRRWEVQMELADAAGVVPGLARAWVTQVDSNVMHSAAPAHIKATVLGNLCIRWAALKEADRLAECEKAAEAAIRQVQNIEQPSGYALLGEAYARLGDAQKALLFYEQAVELATGLTVLRPRAKAAVDICLSLERSGLKDRRVEAALGRLLASCGVAHD